MTENQTNQGKAPSHSVARARRRSVYWLQSRVEEYLLEKVRRLFEPVAQVCQESDAEALHQMRISSRRLRVGLRFFSALFSESERKQVQRQLRRITRALGEIRALDVNVKLLRRAARRLPASAAKAREALVHDMLIERSTRLAELRELMNVLGMGKLEQRIRHLITLRDAHHEARRILKAAAEQLNKLRRSMRKRYRQYRKKNTAASFHQFRIAAKRYRYGLEAAEAVFRVEVRSRIRAVEELQDVMGDCHDLQVMLACLADARERWSRKDLPIATGIGHIQRVFRDELDGRFERFADFIEEDRIWLKKVKLEAKSD